MSYLCGMAQKIPKKKDVNQNAKSILDAFIAKSEKDDKENQPVNPEKRESKTEKKS